MTSPTVAPSAAESERIVRANRAAALGVDGVAALVSQLDDPSWVVRRAVIQLVVKAGESAVSALIDALRTQRDSENRVAAVVEALASTHAAVDMRVIELQHDANPAVVADAAEILGRRRSRVANPMLRELVEGEHDVIAVAAIEALGRIGGRAAVDTLVAAVKSGRFFRTFPAIDVLGRTGDPRALAPLTELLEDDRFMSEAARALGHTGDPGAVGPLLELVKRPGDAIVRVAALALVELRDTYSSLYGNAEAIDLLVRDRAAPATARRIVAAMRTSGPTEQAVLIRILGAVGSDEAFPVLSAALDGPEAVARPAAEALKRLGAAGMLSLSNALRHGDSARRLLILGVMQPRAVAIDDVIVTLDDPDGAVRAKACDLLGRIGQPSAVPAVFQLLCDPNPRVSHAALGAIQALGGELTESLAVSAASSVDSRLARQAFRLIGYFGFARGIEALLRGLSHDDSQLRELAVQSLGYIDDEPAKHAVMRVSRDADPRMRAAAMRALGHRPATFGATRLLEALEDEDAWVRYYACQSLGRLQHEESAPAIARRLADPAGQVRVSAIEAMSRLQSAAATSYLLLGARSPDDDVRRACLTGMAISKRPEALPFIIEATSAPDAATRLVATSAIAAFDTPEVPRRLAELAVGDADDAVRFAALAALGERPGRDATTALIGLLDHPDMQARARELLSMSIHGRVEGILHALRDADDDAAARLTSALARMRAAEGYSALVAALSLANPSARKAAAITAAAIGSRALTSALRGRENTDPDPEVRRVIASALRN